MKGGRWSKKTKQYRFFKYGMLLLDKIKSYCIYQKTTGIVKLLGILYRFFDIIYLSNIIIFFYIWME